MNISERRKAVSHTDVLRTNDNVKRAALKVKDKVHPRTGHESPEGE
jgi:hypothetical protein